MRDLKKGVRYAKTIADPDYTFGKEGGGWLEGYAATFGNIDSADEMIMAGAFAKSLGDGRVRDGKVPLMTTHYAHGGGDLDIIGGLSDAREDATGLWVHGDFSETDVAQAVREQVMGKSIKHLSVGYELMRWEVDRTDGKAPVAKLHELKLLDVVVTGTPINGEAAIFAAKSALDTAIAVCTGDGRIHVDGKQVLDLAERLRATAATLESVITPQDTGKSAVQHLRAELLRRRLQLLKLK